MKKVMKKKEETDEFAQKGAAKELLIQKYYQFSSDYERNPRLHLTWFKKMAEGNKDHTYYVEAGMCELHMVHYIYTHIANRSIDLPIHQLTDICSDFLSKEDSMELDDSNDCSFDRMIEHIDKGIDCFTKSQLYHYALALANFKLPFYERTVDYTKLAQCHSDIDNLY